MRPVRLNRPSRRAVRNQLEFMAGGSVMEQSVKRGKQAESAIGEANRQWARLKGGVLYRNRRGLLPLPNGGMLPIGLGPKGFPDECGYLPVRITASMVNKVLPVACFIEDKTDSGVVASHQLSVIEQLRDDNCIAGVSRSPGDCEALDLAWLMRVTA